MINEAMTQAQGDKGPSLGQRLSAIELVACIIISVSCIIGRLVHDGWSWQLICAAVLTLSSPLPWRVSSKRAVPKKTRACADAFGVSTGVALLPAVVSISGIHGAATALSAAMWIAAVSIFGLGPCVTAGVSVILLVIYGRVYCPMAWFAAVATPPLAHILLSSCPQSFSIAESGAVSAVLSSAIALGLKEIYQPQKTTCGDSSIDAVVRIGLCGCALLCLLSVVLVAGLKSSRTGSFEENVRAQKLAFWTTLNFSLVVLLTYVFTWQVGTGCEPVSWLIRLISRRQEWGLIMIWVALILVAVAMARQDRGRMEKAVARKFFHGIAAAVFGVGLSVDHDLTRIGAIGGLGLLCFAEAIRVGGYGKIRDFVVGVGDTFLDERDAGVVAVTHLYLLLGCSVPVWMGKGGVARAGVVAVCVQDGVAAAVGRRVGTVKWGRRGRTVEGSLAGLLAGALTWAGWTQGNILTALLAASATALIEAFTDQIDNWVVPMTFYLVIAVTHKMPSY